jgi:hypothetical protein
MGAWIKGSAKPNIGEGQIDFSGFVFTWLGSGAVTSPANTYGVSGTSEQTFIPGDENKNHRTVTLILKYFKDGKDKELKLVIDVSQSAKQIPGFTGIKTVYYTDFATKEYLPPYTPDSKPIKKRGPETVYIQQGAIGGRPTFSSVLIYRAIDNMRINVYVLYNNKEGEVLQQITITWELEVQERAEAKKSEEQLEIIRTNLHLPTPQLQIIWSTDQLGSNLGEIVCLVEGNYLPYEQYPIKLIGKYSWFYLSSTCSKDSNSLVYFSKHPNLMPVMKGCATKTYLQKTIELNDTDLSNIEFYLNLLSFMSLRYYLGGLTSGKLTRKWLLQSMTEQFYINMANSEFAGYITLFTETYKGYDRYMLIDCIY